MKPGGRYDEQGCRSGPPEPVFVNVNGAQKSIPPSYVAWRAGTTNRVVVQARQAISELLKRSTDTGCGYT